MKVTLHNEGWNLIIKSFAANSWGAEEPGHIYIYFCLYFTLWFSNGIFAAVPATWQRGPLIVHSQSCWLCNRLIVSLLRLVAKPSHSRKVSMQQLRINHPWVDFHVGFEPTQYSMRRIKEHPLFVTSANF